MANRGQKLQELTAMILDVELAKLRDLAVENAEINAQITAIRGARADRFDQIRDIDEIDIVQKTGADILWMGWQDKKIRELNQKQALLRVKMEELRKSSQRAFGRDEAAKKLAAKIAIADRAKRLKKI